MKSLPRTWKYFLGAVAIVSIVACATIMPGRETHIAIRPEMNVKNKECDEINAVLAKFDKTLYKIQTYKAGNLVRTRGELPEKYTEPGLTAKITEELKANKFTGCTVQGGVFSGSSTRPSPTPAPPPRAVAESKELIERLRPILDKYAGSATKPQPYGGSSTKPSPSPSPSPTAAKSAELIERLKPIIDKYRS